MKLQKYLEEKQIQKSVFAETIGVSNVRLSKILHGRIRMDIQTANAVHEATKGEVSFKDWLEELTKTEEET